MIRQLVEKYGFRMYLIADIWIHVIRMQARSFIHYNMIHDIFQADISYPNICNATTVKLRYDGTY